jgi:hypothetical protein
MESKARSSSLFFHVLSKSRTSKKLDRASQGPDAIALYSNARRRSI